MKTSWRVTLNHSHFAVWGRIGMWWLTLIVMALIFGPHARTDELLFATIVLPLSVLVPYALGTLAIAWAKTMLLPWLRGARRQLVANHRLRDQRGRADDRHPRPVARSAARAVKPAHRA
jgi:hypothetical protein